MEILLEPIIIFLLALTAYQDFKTRSVYWFAFPLLFLSFLALNYAEYHSFFFKETLLNLLFFVFQLMLVTIYFSIKNRKLISITDDQIGWGDILFLLSITPVFSLPNYILYYVSSLLFSIALFVTYLISGGKQKTIPLAGMQALMLASLLLAMIVSKKTTLLRSDSLLKIIYS